MNVSTSDGNNTKYDAGSDASKICPKHQQSHRHSQRRQQQHRQNRSRRSCGCGVSFTRFPARRRSSRIGSVHVAAQLWRLTSNLPSGGFAGLAASQITGQNELGHFSTTSTVATTSSVRLYRTLMANFPGTLICISLATSEPAGSSTTTKPVQSSLKLVDLQLGHTGPALIIRQFLQALSVKLLPYAPASKVSL